MFKNVLPFQKQATGRRMVVLSSTRIAVQLLWQRRRRQLVRATVGWRIGAESGRNMRGAVQEFDALRFTCKE